MKKAKCPSCGLIRQPGEFGSTGECTKCGAFLIGTPKPSAEMVLKKRAANKQNRADKNKERENLNKLVITNLIIWPLLLLIAVINSPDKPIIDTNKNQQQAKEIQAYMKRNFGAKGHAASWFIEIDDIQISQTDESRYIVVSTLLDKNENSTANNMCNAFSNYWVEHQSEFSGLRIIGINQQIISYRYSLNAMCS